MRGSLSVVVLGLSLSSSWGNGHATTYRALLNALAARGHRVTFIERDTPWYAAHRDLTTPGFCTLGLYSRLSELDAWRSVVAAADVVIVGSFVPDGIAVGQWVQATARGVTAFYDIDTPVTLAQLKAGACGYLSPDLIPGFDLYLSFTGGPTLDLLMDRYGAPAARPLYCSVDPEAYFPIEAAPQWDLSYLGTYSADRQPTLDQLLLEVADRAPDLRFAVGGSQYPSTIRWPANVERLEHVPPAKHAAFYGASRFTLNVTRREMILAGYSPSVRLFEAAACGAPIISDIWDGIETIFRPGREILLATDPVEVLALLRGARKRHRAGLAARRRVLQEHTADMRAVQLERYLQEASASPPLTAESGSADAIPA